MRTLRAVQAAGRAWVRLYTAGLPDEVRQRRRDEIESDFFEQERAATRTAGPGTLTWPVASRIARGVPSDVTWRVARELEPRPDDELTASLWGKAAVLVVLSIAATSLVYAILHTFGFFGHTRLYAFIQVGMMIGALALLKGMTMSKASPRAGGALVLLSGLAMAFLWMFVPPVALAVLIVTIYGALRALRFAREERKSARLRRAVERDEEDGGGARL